MFHGNRYTLGYFTLLVTFLCASATAHASAIDMTDADILAIESPLTDILDQQIKPIRGKKKRLIALHSLLYFPENFDIQYSAGLTQTAMETFTSRRGNCVSLSNLFVAAARHVGLKAKFQSVRVERTWLPQNGFYEVPGHMNVVVDMGREVATIEFNEAFFQNLNTNKFDTEIISDKEAKAEYYNNLGADKLTDNKPFEAIPLFLKGIEFNKKLDFIWSNLGVAYKQIGNYQKAEMAYSTALKINKYNKSAISNIYILYKELGDQKHIATYAKRAEAYARKNPYFLAKLADERIEAQDYPAAIKLLKSAIKAHKREPLFYHALSVAYYYHNDLQSSQQALKNAVKYAAQDHDKNRYQQKIDALAKRH